MPPCRSRFAQAVKLSKRPLDHSLRWGGERVGTLNLFPAMCRRPLIAIKFVHVLPTHTEPVNDCGESGTSSTHD